MFFKNVQKALQKKDDHKIYHLNTFKDKPNRSKIVWAFIHKNISMCVCFIIYIYIYTYYKLYKILVIYIYIECVCVCVCVCALVFFERKQDRARIAVTYAELKCHKHKAARNEQSF